MDPICYIFGAMDPGPVAFAEQRPPFIIAADAGLEHLTARGITPDLAVGDFDSLGRVPEEIDLLRYPSEKDDTDMLLAIRAGLRRGCLTFVIYGGLGGRLDHTVANLQSLSFLSQQGGAGWLVGDGIAVSLVRNGTMSFPAGWHGTLSVFCSGAPAEGVDLECLRYPLRDAVLTSGFPLGVSNQFTGQPAWVTVRKGELLLIWEETPESLVSRLDRRSAP